VRSDYDFNVGYYSFVKGLNEVNGTEGLIFARDRKQVGSDRQRGKHQMEVVKGVINKMTSPALLKNYSEIMKSLEGSFETTVPYDMVAKLVRNQLDKGTKWNMVSYAVNGTGATRKVYSLSQKAYVMIPDQSTIDEANRLIKQVLDGEKPTLAP
jgi:anionic cell wall polymer biosynthesis LytR-Cps2A-Psr (LCP) family protein